MLFALFEQVANATCTDTHEHLHEVRARDAEKRHPRLTRDGARKQRFTGAGWANHEHPLRDAASEALEFLRILKKRDDLFNFVFGFVCARDVSEGHLVL